MEPASNSRKRQLITTLAVLIMVVAIVAAVTVTNKKDDDMVKTSDVTTSTPDTSTTPDTTTPDTTTTTTSPATYKDGTYTATGSYDSPGGNESITVTVTLANDIITSTSATSGANDTEAHEYQNEFISEYKSLVVGKDISSVHLSRVSGSSLTSQGFNSAIQKIESQANA
jgi:uncharacterized protein with FMN-binding domain